MQRWRFRYRDAEHTVAMAFALLVVGTLAVAAAHASFWAASHDTAPVAGAITLLLVAALLRRHRWAWWIFLIFSVAGIPSFVVDRVANKVSWTAILGLLVGLIELAVLLSTPMRRYVGLGGGKRAASTAARS